MRALRRSSSTSVAEGPAAARSTTVREALLAEALGDLHRLLQRVDVLSKEIEDARVAMESTVSGMGKDVDNFKREILASTEFNKKNHVNFMLRHTEAMAERLLQVQVKAMSQSAHELFEKELDPQLRRLALNLKQQTERKSVVWDTWILGASVALAAAAVTSCAFSVYPVARAAAATPPEATQAPTPETPTTLPTAKPPPQKPRAKSM